MTTTAITMDTRVRMRDGVALATDVYLPPGDGRRPALLQRTPYGKNVAAITSLTFETEAAVARGYAVVIQDCRGTGASDGELHALINERADGHDTIEWIAGQPWCDGRVGVYGSSYMGVTALQATIDAPAALRASMVYLTAATYHDGWVYTGGALELGFSLRWTLDQAKRIADARGIPPGDAIREVAARFKADPVGFCAASYDLRTLPGAAALAHWREWLDHKEYDDYWAALDARAAAARGGIRVPLLQVAGWYDPFARSQIALHQTLVGDHRLVVGPWDHNAYLSPDTWTKAGSRDFGADAAGGRAGVGPLALRWFDCWLGNGTAHGLPPVRYFAIGPDVWRDVQQWPPQHQMQRWHLHAGGVLASASPADENIGDELANQRPGASANESADSFRYDPASPAPTLGGRNLLAFLPSGVQDQSTLADRADVLAYTSAPLAQPLMVAGPVRLEIHFRSTAPLADVVATLVDIAPSGEAFNVADGVLRFKPTNGAVTVELGEVAYELARGHRLGLYVTSSSFPRFDRIPQIATQQVLHDREHPSVLVLPVQV